MYLVEQTSVPTGDLPLAELRAHLRLGTGFGDDTVQDAMVEPCLRAAIAAIEGRVGKAVLRRSFSWTLTDWRDLARQALPMAPVSRIDSVTITDRFAVQTVSDPSDYRLIGDAHRPILAATGFCLPRIPVSGSAEVVFEAGFAATWDRVPGDLAQAVLLLAAQYYETRHDLSGTVPAFPVAVLGLIAPYRQLRLLGGGAR